MKKLPDKLSSLLRIAVKDSKKCAKMKSRLLDMAEYHTYDHELKQCRVCMAGSVMDRTLKVPFKYDLLPSHFLYRKELGGNVDTRDRLRAIDHMRSGEFFRAHGALFPDKCLTDEQGVALSGARKAVLRKYDKKLDRASWVAYENASKILEQARL